MTVDDDDWRLMGQESWLKNAVLREMEYTPNNPSNDHDHCEFCGTKFMNSDSPEILHRGFTTADRSRWICLTCFKDFRDRFNWTLLER